MEATERVLSMGGVPVVQIVVQPDPHLDGHGAVRLLDLSGGAELFTTEQYAVLVEIFAQSAPRSAPLDPDDPLAVGPIPAESVGYIVERLSSTLRWQFWNRPAPPAPEPAPPNPDVGGWPDILDAIGDLMIELQRHGRVPAGSAEAAELRRAALKLLDFIAD